MTVDQTTSDARDCHAEPSDAKWRYELLCGLARQITAARPCQANVLNAGTATAYHHTTRKLKGMQTKDNHQGEPSAGADPARRGPAQP